VDYHLVQQLRGQTAERLRAERRRRAEQGSSLLSDEDERQLGRSLIAAVLDEHRRDELLAHAGPMPTAEEDRDVAEAVHAAIFGLGRLEPIINQPDLAHVDVNGADRVWLHHLDGRIEAGPPVADSDAELIEWVRTAATYSGLTSRPFDAVHPWLELRLPDGSRLCAFMSVVDRPVVSIRLYRLQKVRLADLRERGSFDDRLWRFLEALVASRANIIVSGETFAGKTMLMRALGNAVPFRERIITAEHFLELGYEHYPDLHRDVVAMEERLPNAEGVGAITLADLVEHSRRLNPDRILVGEVIGGEIVSMLDAMTQGENGSISTLHARDSKMVFERIMTYAMRGAERLPREATGMLIGGGLDFVVHMSIARLPDGRLHRYISSVREVLGFDGTQVVSTEVFAAPPGEMLAVPKTPIGEQRVGRLAAAGYDNRVEGGAR
jgi:Flp pilus assembly CpaF family ATPase